ncbi:MAG: fibronectin type III domain-containing protein [Microthrixaceae bacterium]|nr:fibronectin type III domain-containing protein [Microthrixaceae bacterium]
MKKFLVALTIAVLAVVASACAPTFPAGSQVTASDSYLGTDVEWSLADPPDEGGYISEYRIDVDGVEVARVSGYTSACTLVGLDPLTEYVMSVTAYDGNGAWSGGFSGDYAAIGTLTVNHTTSEYAVEGPLDCIYGDPM